MASEMDAATRFALLGSETGPGPGILPLINGGVYDVRRVAVGPGQAHGPGRHPGDAVVVVLEGSVAFSVDGQTRELTFGDLLWVPAGTLRGFVAGAKGALLLAIHLPRGQRAADASLLGAADQDVIARVTQHHAALADRLDQLTAAVVGCLDASSLDASLCALLEYWRQEIVPHAAAEETTFYAETRDAAAQAGLIEALEMEHQDLRARVRDLEDLLTQGRQGTGTAREDGELSSALRARAALQAVAAAALFRLHARKENEIVLLTLVVAGVPLPPLLQRMEQAFLTARAEAGPA